MKVSLKGIQSESRVFCVCRYIPLNTGLAVSGIEYVHTLPLRCFCEARVSGAGMGGKDMADMIPLLRGGR